MTIRNEFLPEDKIKPGPPPEVYRYGPLKRTNHWITAGSLILLGISGLAMFHPSLFFLTALFGGGQNTRLIHPWIGVLLFVSFFVFFFQIWRANLPSRADVQWAMQIQDVVNGHEERLPEVGRYNAGQKFVFWGMAFFIIVLIASGIIIWDQYFENATPIDVRRLALLIHSASAVIILLIFLLHLYSGIWVRGTIRAMTRGTVTPGWAYRHHRKWFKALAKSRNIDAQE